jgi:hypothetical protein
MMFDNMIAALPQRDLGHRVLQCDERASFQRLAPEACICAFEANRSNLDQFIAKRIDVSRVNFEYAAVCDVNAASSGLNSSDLAATG